MKKKRGKAIEGLQGKERIEVFDKFDKKINLVEKNYNKIIKDYLSKIQEKSCLEYYKDFLNNYLIKIVNENNNDIICENQELTDVVEYLKNSTLLNLKNNEIAFEDLAPIMYLQYKIIGIKDKCKIKHVVIDEAQDYGEFQFDILKTILNSNSMTI